MGESAKGGAEVIRYGSVCSGVEAASLAWQPLGWEPAFFAEVEPFPCAVLQQRFGATKPLRPLDPDDATDEKDRKMREAWLKQINRLPDGGTIPNLGDFTKIRKEDYHGDIDLLVGGTPCQDVSTAGKRAGFGGARSSLALDFVRLAYELGCQWFVWENVPGAFTSNDGRDFATLLSLFVGREIGVPEQGFNSAGFVCPTRRDRFGMAWRVLDSQFTRTPRFPFAIPQRRRRVFLVGCLGSWERAATVLLEPERMCWNTPTRRKTRPSSSGHPQGGTESASAIRMRAGCEGGGKGALVGDDLSHTLQTGNDQTIVELAISNSHSDGGNVCDTIGANYFKGIGNRIGNERPFICTVDKHMCRTFDIAPTIEKEGAHELAVGFIENDAGGEQYRFGDYLPSLRVKATAAVATSECIPLDLRNATRDPEKKDDVNRQGCGVGVDGDPMTTITAASVPGVWWMATVRKLTPVECERLMGFPDNHTRISWNGKPEEQCPDAPRYKACGNSMCVNCMEWIGLRIDSVLSK